LDKTRPGDRHRPPHACGEYPCRIQIRHLELGMNTLSRQGAWKEQTTRSRC
jgi:hypothetical protein